MKKNTSKIISDMLCGCHCHHVEIKPLPCFEIKKHQLKCKHCYSGELNCLRCDGEGQIVTCIDNKCADSECLHDGEYSTCPECKGRGEV